MNADTWYAPETATFGDRLSAARESAGMTQDELAKRLGVRVATLRSWENDRSEPRANRLSIMAGILNVSMGWLINCEGAGVPAPGDSEKAANTAAREELRALRHLIAEAGDRIDRLEKAIGA